jgi:Mrp family chromosome partitioning ATPase
MTREMDGAPAGPRITELDPHSACVSDRITLAEIPAVAAFLHTAVDARLSVAQWRVVFRASNRTKLTKLAHKFGATLTEARNLFDIILHDLPPLAAVADARSLTASCDFFVLIAKWGQTDRGAVWKFLESETEIGERLLGVVLNKVDLARWRQYEQSHDPQYYPYRKFSAMPAAIKG